MFAKSQEIAELSKHFVMVNVEVNLDCQTQLVGKMINFFFPASRVVYECRRRWFERTFENLSKLTYTKRSSQNHIQTKRENHTAI